MLKLLCPDNYIDSIYDIDTEHLKDLGIKGILIDLDNTLAAWDQTQVTEQVREWANNLKAEGFSLCIVSNNKAKRIKHYSRQLGVPAIWGRFKPSPGAFKKGMARIDTSPRETLMIGDQVFTDILGANLLGIKSILVKPIDNQEFLWTKIMRKLEKRVLHLLMREHRIPSSHL